MNIQYCILGVVIALAGFSDWEEPLGGGYWLMRGPWGHSANAVAIFTEDSNGSHTMVSGPLKDSHCMASKGVIIAELDTGDGVLIDIAKGEKLIGPVGTIENKAREYGVSWPVLWWALHRERTCVALAVAGLLSVSASILIGGAWYHRRRKRMSLNA